MITLADYLGGWVYSDMSGRNKAWLIEPSHITNVPHQLEYVISWNDDPNDRLYVDATTAFKRVLDKQASGYTLEAPYAGTVPASAKITITEITRPKNPNAFNWNDWLNGKDFPNVEK